MPVENARHFVRQSTRYKIAAYLAVLDGLRRRSTVKVDSGGPDTEKLQLHWKSRGANSEHLRFGRLPILQSL
jgi:hypothetical protein